MRYISRRGKERIFFGVLFVLGFLISASIWPYADISFDRGQSRVTADLMYALCITAGMLAEDRRGVATEALVAGALSDFFLTPPMHFSPLLFFLAAYLAHRTIGTFSRANAVTAAVASLPFCLLRTLTGAIYLLSAGEESFSFAVGSILLPELACNVVTIFFAYLIIGFLYKKIVCRRKGAPDIRYSA